METDEERRAVLEEQTRQVILQQKVAFAKKEDEDNFVRSAVDRAMRGESCFIPSKYSIRMDTIEGRVLRVRHTGPSAA